jgi:uncharacterized protein
MLPNGEFGLLSVPELPNPYLTTLLLGLFYGLAACSSACLPYIASYIAGVGAGFRKGLVLTLTYNFGRVTAYALIGGLIGILAGLFKLLVDESLIASFQPYSSLAFGVLAVLVGMLIFIQNRSSCKCSHPEKTKRFFQYRRFDIGAFVLGLSKGLLVCPPLIALLIYSASFASPLDSLILAVLFGLGTAISPTLLLGGALTGWLLNKAPLFKRWISIAGGAFLIILGTGTLINQII